MKILVAADMEGITGVTTWDQVTAGHFEYARFRRLMTEDVNAAVRGAFEAGAEKVVVTDGHGSGSNILVEELDQRASLNTGSPSPLSMVQGVNEVDGMIYVGYHARAGSPNGILDHTWSSKAVANVWLNDILMGEYGLNAAVAGHFGVPVLMVSGDQTVCEQATELLGNVETVVVKQATGRFSAECLPPSATHAMIQKAASQAVTRLVEGTAPAPFVLSKPISLSIEFVNSAMADHAMRMPGAERGGTCVSFTLPDAFTAYNVFRTVVELAKVV